MASGECVRGCGSEGLSLIDIPDPTSNTVIRVEIHPSDECYPVSMCPEHIAEVVSLWAIEQARMGEMNESNYNRIAG